MPTNDDIISTNDAAVVRALVLLQDLRSVPGANTLKLSASIDDMRRVLAHVEGLDNG